MLKAIPRNGCSIWPSSSRRMRPPRRSPWSPRRRLCAALSRSMPAVADGRIRFIALKPRELRLCTHRSLSIAAFARWWTMRRYLARSGADFGFFLSLDLLCLPFALGLPRPGKPIAGILFRPSVHYAVLAATGPARRETAGSAQGSALPADVAQSERYSRCCRSILFSRRTPLRITAMATRCGRCPTRVIRRCEVAVACTRVVDFVPPGRIGLLLFGYLTERKGPLMVLDALRLLPPALPLA